MVASAANGLTRVVAFTAFYAFVNGGSVLAWIFDAVTNNLDILCSGMGIFRRGPQVTASHCSSGRHRQFLHWTFGLACQPGAGQRSQVFFFLCAQAAIGRQATSTLTALDLAQAEGSAHQWTS